MVEKDTIRERIFYWAILIIWGTIEVTALLSAAILLILFISWLI